MFAGAPPIWPASFCSVMVFMSISRSSCSAISSLSTTRTSALAKRNHDGGGDTSGTGGSLTGGVTGGDGAASRCTVTEPFWAGVFGVNVTAAFQCWRSLGAACEVQLTSAAQASCSATVGACGSASAGWIVNWKLLPGKSAAMAACTAVARRHASLVLYSFWVASFSKLASPTIAIAVLLARFWKCSR